MYLDLCSSILYNFNSKLKLGVRKENWGWYAPKEKYCHIILWAQTTKFDLIKYYKDDTKDQCYEVIYFTIMIFNCDDKWYNLLIRLFPSVTSLKLDFSLES